ncbi:very short patch repair endonuclease [Bradyrhizobium campsiandrae]|nr:very short patch repair endonuclease [Bradyrhizobium campsiandrae]
MAVHRRATVRARPKRPYLKAAKRAAMHTHSSKESYPSLRSWTMAQVRSENTKPEMAVRKVAHALGLRFRLHRKDLPGKPDLVFASRRIALFVHGCFWHRHDCGRAATPASNVEYWTAKFDRNVRRDARAAADLRKAGWRCVRIWECEAKDPRKLAGIIRRRVIARSPNTR